MFNDHTTFTPNEGLIRGIIPIIAFSITFDNSTKFTGFFAKQSLP